MSAFSSANFNSEGYAQFRPNYDDSLFDFIHNYHTGESKLAVDIGCGSGQAAYPLSTYFDKVIGTDLSAKMIETANKKVSGDYVDKLEFRVSPAEELGFLADNSVDLITAAQCIHWFNHTKFFKEVARVLKPGGTLAFWGYADPVFNDAIADKMAMDFTYDDPTKLGPYWEQPGRNLLRDLLKDVNAPDELFDQKKTWERRPGVSGDSPLEIKRQIPLEYYSHYVKTWSSYHRWKEAHQNQEDISDIYIKQLQAKMGWTPKTVVNIEWLTVLKLAKRRL